MTYRDKVRKDLNVIIDDIMAIQDAELRYKASQGVIETLTAMIDEIRIDGIIISNDELSASTNNNNNKERI